MSWLQKKKEGKTLTSEEALAERQWRKAEATKFNENFYWNQVLKPELDKVQKFLEQKILNGQCESHEIYLGSCSQREGIKNIFSLLEKDLKP